MIATLWNLLVECTLATSAAVALVLTLRSAVARRFGFGAAYGLWSVVPLSLLAVLLPARTVDTAVTMVSPQLLQSYAVAVPTAAGATAWLVACWAVGALAMLLIQLHRQRRFVDGLGPLRPRDDGLYASDNARGLPAVTGLLRHRIIVPSSFETRYTAHERELVLHHERVHVRRGDLHANALAMLLRAVFWFNPLLVAAADRFRRDQELACDEAVIARFPDSRRAYADAMLKTQLAARALPLACHWNGTHPLKERIAMLKTFTPDRRTARAGLLTVSIIGLFAATALWAAQPATPVSQNAGEPSMPPEVQGTAPAYPSSALTAKVSGKVVLLVDVAADGSVTGAEVESADPAGVFEASTLEAVKSWKFQPAMEAGKPVAGRVRVPVTFEAPAPATAPVAPAVPLSSPQTSSADRFDWVEVNVADVGSLRELDCDAMRSDASTPNLIACGVDSTPRYRN